VQSGSFSRHVHAQTDTADRQPATRQVANLRYEKALRRLKVAQENKI
jgi:hypothetical protein